ncbi:hypothetical protein QYF36_005598 [Acer negundo]|nr:hypothetical protein QYF36_005598 [Acer negundo]
MNQQLNASKRHQSIRGEILSARMILDVHLHSDTSKFEWEDGLILNPMKFSEEKICKRKCKSQYNLDSFYHLLKCDANWVRQLDNGYVKRNGNLVSIDVHHLVSAAQSYWSAELLSVGMKVLDNLEALYKLSMMN